MSSNDTSVYSDSPWLVAHFRRHADELRNLRDVTRLSVDGIYGIVESPRILEAIVKLEKSRGIESSSIELSEVKASAALAQVEVERGFSLIYCNLMVSLWGHLEAQTRTLVALWLENVDGSMKGDRLQKLKIQLGEYEERQGRARFQYIVSTLERDLGAALKNGTDRFESLLSAVELSGAVPRLMKKRLFELAQIRNCIVHNGRVVDEQLIAQCPWLGLALGSVLSPPEEQVRNMFQAVTDYTILIMARASGRLGKPMDTTVSEIFESWQESVQQAVQGDRPAPGGLAR